MSRVLIAPGAFLLALASVANANERLPTPPDCGKYRLAVQEHPPDSGRNMWCVHGREEPLEDQIVGKFISLRGDGSTRLELRYEHGVRHGVSRSYHPNGEVASETSWELGKPNGLVRQYHENGRLSQRVYYVDGKRNGLFEEWNEDGQKTAESAYSNGVLEGAHRTWHSNGTLRQAGRYSDGKPTGSWVSYHRNEQKLSEGEVVEGERVGPWSFWNPDGSLEAQYNYGRRAGQQTPQATASGEPPEPANTVESDAGFRGRAQ